MVKNLKFGFAGAILALAAGAQFGKLAGAPNADQQPRPTPILVYIRATWGTLTRSNRTLAAAAVDPKSRPEANGRLPVYIPVSEDAARIAESLRREMSATDFAKIDLRPMPADPARLTMQGLLYLPGAYGARRPIQRNVRWESYFIQLGLLRENLVPLAKSMVDNFLYEIRNYGMILNANRTYYLSRSQPPFLTEMILNVCSRTHDRQWLEAAMPEVEKYYRYWTSEPHLTPSTGLARYFDLGDGPAPEVLASEKDAKGRMHYDLVQDYFRTHKVTAYDASQYYDAATDRLTQLFYKGDRSMRESGFDPSDRFGPFNIDIIHYDPVCLNSLLHVIEEQTAEMLRALGRPGEAVVWDKRASDRAERINSLMWDERDGLYYDYDFVHKDLCRYPFLTTFYPLWAGIASPKQAARLVANLPLFERAGGLQTSTNVSGSQWDAPFGWAPLGLLVVKGLRRYGFALEADRISQKFLSLVMDRYRQSGISVEKYDVIRRSTELGRELHFGYRTNEAGIGWTNAAFTALWDDLPAEKRERLMAGAGGN